MIYLNQNSTNQICLSTPTKSTGSTPSSYTMNLKNLMNDIQLTGVTLNMLTGNTRYNMFEMTLSGISYQNLSGSTIYLKNSGQYLYSVYGGDELLEVGICNVI